MALVGAFDGFIAHQDGCVVVVVSGEIDLAVTTALVALTEQALAASPHVVFDMGGITFLDSSGLRVLAMAATRVAGIGSVTLRNSPPMVTRVLHLAGLDELITVESSRVA